MDLIDITIDLSGGLGWHVVDEPHRCSRGRCAKPAVAYLVRERHEPRWPAQLYRRFECADHLAELGGKVVHDGRVWRPMTEWEVSMTEFAG